MSLQSLHVVLHICTRAGGAQRRRERSQVAARFAVGAQRGFSNLARVEPALGLRLDSLGPADALGLGGFLRVSQLARQCRSRARPKYPLLPRRCIASLRCSVTPLAARAACCVPSLQPWLRLALPWPARSLARLPVCPCRLPSSCGTTVVFSVTGSGSCSSSPHTTPAAAQHSIQSRPCLPHFFFQSLCRALPRSASPCLFRCPRCVCISRPSRGNPSSVQSALVAQSQPRSRLPLCIFRLPRRLLVWIRGTARRDALPASLASACYSTQTSPLALLPLLCLAPTTYPPPPSIPTASFLPLSLSPRNYPSTSCLNPRHPQSYAEPRRKSKRQAPITAHRSSSRDSFRHIF